MSPRESRHLLKVCSERAFVDLTKGRKTWITRYMVVHLALNSGLRVSELAALTIGDLHIKSTSDTYLIVQHGKGRGDNGKKRTVYLDRDIVKHLLEYIDLKTKTLHESTNITAPLFAGREGQPFSTTGLHLSYKKAIRAAELPNQYSIHGARHTYATMLLAKTNNLRFVQKQLGHASINMTALYADVLPELNQNLANAILD
ncbi:MAG: tyrosine-type recombinase/integrase [Desulfobulbaceae bacterium]